MAEQAQKQEAKQGETKAPERPQVRRIRLQAGGVFLDQSRDDLDLEGKWAQANQATAEIHPGKGVVIRRANPKPGGEKLATWIPESHVRQADVAPEWKP